MFAASAFSHASGYHSMWLSEMLSLVGDVHKLLQVSTSWYLKCPFAVFNKASAYPCATPNPLCKSKKGEGATTNYLISYLSKLNWFWSGCCQKKKKKKETLKPGEDFRVYTSKPAASICHDILFKKNLDWTIPLSGLLSLQVWKTGKVLKQGIKGFVMKILQCPSLWGCVRCPLGHPSEKLPQQLMMTDSYVNGFQEPGSGVSTEKSPLQKGC